MTSITDPITFTLTDKVVMVTDAYPGEDLGIAAHLAAAGADLALTAPDPSVLEPALAETRSHGRTARGYRLDWHDLDSIRTAVDSVVADFGRIDVLVNNVGYNVPAWGVDVTPADWAEIQQINLTGPFFCAQAAGRHMLAAGSGRVINVGTHTAIKSNVRRAAYGSARAGMAQFTRNLALEWADKGVTVNSVAPSYIKAHNLELHPAMYDGMRQRNPMHRFASEREVVAAIQYLAADVSGYVTGQVLAVDGGSCL